MKALLVFSFAVFLSAACFAVASFAASGGYRVSQRHRAFDPGTLDIARGETIEIVNDDGELQHHAYVKSPEFSFDSGEQSPGDKVDIQFTRSGHFTVLCGIHPRMHLEVTVN